MRRSVSPSYKSFLFPKTQGPAVFLDSLLLLAVYHLITSRLRYRKCSQMLKESCLTLVLSIVPWKLWRQEDRSNFTPDFQYIVLGLLLMLWYVSLCFFQLKFFRFHVSFYHMFTSLFSLCRWLGFSLTKFRRRRRNSDCDLFLKDTSAQLSSIRITSLHCCISTSLSISLISHLQSERVL